MGCSVSSLFHSLDFYLLRADPFLASRLAEACSWRSLSDRKPFKEAAIFTERDDFSEIGESLVLQVRLSPVNLADQLVRSFPQLSSLRSPSSRTLSSPSTSVVSPISPELLFPRVSLINPSPSRSRQPFDRPLPRVLRSESSSNAQAASSVRSLQDRPVPSDLNGTHGGLPKQNERSDIVGGEDQQQGQHFTPFRLASLLPR